MTIASTQQISAVVDADRDKTIALDVVTIPSVRGDETRIPSICTTCGVDVERAPQGRFQAAD